IELLNILVNQGISREENIFESIKKRAINITNNYLSTDESILDQAVRKIIHEKVTYKELHYGTEESINSVTFTDLLVVLEEIKLSPRIVTFIGNETAQAALKIKAYFKPSPYFPRLRSNDIEISKPLEIKEASLKEKTGLVVYRYKGCSSEHQFLISLMYPNIIEELLNKSYCSQNKLKVDINQLNGLVVISSSGSELVSEVFLNNLKAILSSEYSNPDLKFVEKEMKQLKRQLVMIKEEPYLLASFIKQVTILGLPTDINVYIEKLDTLKIEDIKSYLVHSSLVGSMNGTK
ncbi:MAG TPA: hypothetical protein DCY93_03210, partial [Firmicutes bacterium]|nr:hypothetical protein [Bacillota bacterium]